MKSLAVYLKEYKKESILAPLFKLLEVVFDLLVPVVVAQIIDVGVAQDNRSYVVQMFFVLKNTWQGTAGGEYQTVAC